MSQAAIDLFVARAVSEEGLELLPYDDATGKPVVAPIGNISWGIGFNLMKCGSPALFRVVLAFLCAPIDAALEQHTWFTHANVVRQSAFIDVAYNAGLEGLLDPVHGFPHMIAAAAVDDWTEASAQCKVADVSLDKSRYAPLRKLLLTEVSP